MTSCHGRACVPRQTQACDAPTLVREQLPVFVQRLEETGAFQLSFVAGGHLRRFSPRLCRRAVPPLRRAGARPVLLQGRGVCPSCLGRHMAEPPPSWSTIASPPPASSSSCNAFATRYDLGLFFHLHALLTDGCFAQPAEDGDDVRFLPVTGLDIDALAAVFAAVHRDLADDLHERLYPITDPGLRAALCLDDAVA